MKVVLQRCETSDQGTFGKLYIDGEYFCETGELPWRDNARGKSCIPAGTYEVRWDPSPKYGFKFEVFDVEDRTTILIHAANLMGDEDLGFKAEVDGCIALGKTVGYLNKQRALLGSRKKVEEFEALMDKKSFPIEVIDAPAVEKVAA